MAKLIGYGLMSTMNNSLGGHLVKAQCEFCGAKFGSLEEAKKCETGHVNEMLRGLSSEIHKKLKEDLFNG